MVGGEMLGPAVHIVLKSTVSKVLITKEGTMAYRVGKRYLLRGAIGALLGGAVGYYNTSPTDRMFFTAGIAMIGLLVALVFGVLFDLLSIKLF
jgi:hypothetical protein